MSNNLDYILGILNHIRLETCLNLIKMVTFCLFIPVVNDPLRFSCKFLLAFGGLWFQCQFSFQHLCPARSDLSCEGTTQGAVVCSVDQFSVTLVCCSGSDPHMCNSELSPGVHRKLYRIPFFISVLSTVTSKVSQNRSRIKIP